MNKYQFRSLYNLGWTISAQIFWLHSTGKTLKMIWMILFFLGLINTFLDAVKGNR